MAKYQITVEDNEAGVSISVDTPAGERCTAASRVVGAMMQSATLIDRIAMPVSGATTRCQCEVCKAYRELMQTNPTIH